MADPDTELRSGGSQFPPTAWSLLGHLRDPKDPLVQGYLNRMIQLYWRPVYKYVRIAWKRSNEDAKDLTQAFFVRLMEGDLLTRATPERGNFRKLLLVSLKNFLSNEARAAQAVKRGGGRPIISLEGDVEDGGTQDPDDPGAAFEAQWARQLLERAIDLLRDRCRPEVFTAFRRFHLEDAAVREIAVELRASESLVAHHLQDARSALRTIVTEEIRQYVQDETEISRELDSLFKAWQ